MLASEKLIKKNGTAITMIDLIFKINIQNLPFNILYIKSNYCHTFSERNED